MMRQRLTLLLLLLLPLLTSCWSREEINDLAVVSLFAADLTDEGDVQIWLHIVVPKAAGSQSPQGGGKDAPPFITLGATGRTAREAWEQVQHMVSRRLFFAHARAIVFSERLARSGLAPVLDVLSRSRENRLTNVLYVVEEGQLDDLLATVLNLEALPSNHLERTGRQNNDIVATLGRFYQALATDGVDPMLGLLKVVPSPPGAAKGQQPKLQLAGAALFKEDRMIEKVSFEEAVLLAWLKGQAQPRPFTLDLVDSPDPVSLQAFSTRINRRVTGLNNKLQIAVNGYLSSDIFETPTGLDLSKPEVIVWIQQQVAKRLQARVIATFTKMKTLEIDPMGFGEVIHRQRPQAWKQLRDGWRTDGLSRLELTVQVEATIRETGTSSDSFRNLLRQKGQP